MFKYLKDCFFISIVIEKTTNDYVPELQNHCLDGLESEAVF